MASVFRQIIRCSRAPTPVGPYNQAVVVDKTVYVSGAIGMDPKNNQLVTGGVEDETDMALKNIGEVLKDAGSCFDNVVKTTVLLADINDYATVNKVYCKYFPSKYPARAAYQVAALPKGAKVEIEAIAIVGHVKDED